MLQRALGKWCSLAVQTRQHVTMSVQENCAFERACQAWQILRLLIPGISWQVWQNKAVFNVWNSHHMQGGPMLKFYDATQKTYVVQQLGCKASWWKWVM